MDITNFQCEIKVNASENIGEGELTQLFICHKNQYKTLNSRTMSGGVKIKITCSGNFIFDTKFQTAKPTQSYLLCPLTKIACLMQTEKVEEQTKTWGLLSVYETC